MAAAQGERKKGKGGRKREEKEEEITTHHNRHMNGPSSFFFFSFFGIGKSRGGPTSGTEYISIFKYNYLIPTILAKAFVCLFVLIGSLFCLFCSPIALRNELGRGEWGWGRYLELILIAVIVISPDESMQCNEMCSNVSIVTFF